MRRLITAALGLAMTAALAGCSTAGPTDEGNGDDAGRIVLIAKANSADYWIKVRDGAMKAGDDLGVDVTFNGTDTESEGDKQLNMLETAINDAPLGIGFAPQDGAQDGSPRLLEEAEKKGIPVAIFDTPLATSDIPFATVASDNSGMGAQAAERLVELTGGEGSVAVIAHGELGTAAERRDGFISYLEENAPGLEVVDIQNGESDPAKSRDKAQGILQAHPDLVGFFGTDDDSAVAIADEVVAKGSDTVVVGIDATPDVLTLVEEGAIAGVIVQNPFGIGYQTVEILLAASKGEFPSERDIVSESVWVSADNLDDPEVQEVIG
ncbi:substrate-binding domain-containing protein [Tessaracoccus sp. OS52]|uniref:substrate-binding domain-containing protein n=1 Tax=Tessaracoccus sp. OS52 TaxID=2886691 RepID=UPI001D10F424|nr:substrate-binding domain-containing protein [Tessaracoccus sp. OS52]